ncbi:hypothetical protein ABAC460_10545 [Asticcacaulis sp. AC460]|uniref:alginate export family protein n=1 Tax=Asticcacaulis sp. AC460 TaxID=1282360 RepID=UPI0003C3FF44|nr:alginate export family protein [Asticcacaulis sp. AC460]ESQ90181.1 hypothetical protein ABAC460_10545 [Asticcacaulis sp. AC460]
MTNRIRILLTTTAAVAALGVAAGARAEDTVSEAIGASKPIFESSLRSETVDQFGFAEKAEALTWRNRFGFTTGEYKGIKAIIEVDSVEALTENYNSTLNGKTAFPNVVDPEVTEINRAQLSWAATETTTLTVGRQRIILDDARFIGNVGWRQDEQTYDAIRLDTMLGPVKVTGAYIGRVNRIQGDEKDWKSNSYVLNASYSVNEALKFTAFNYTFDFETTATAPTAADIANAKISSVSTTGLRAYGSTWVSSFKLNYVAQYAGQSPSGKNPAADYTLHETMLEGAATWDVYTFKVNYEILEGNGTQGFVTPLGTVHAFEGWADAFASVGGNKTHPNGIKDLSYNLTIAGHTKPWAPWFMNPTLSVIYHDFQTDRLGQDIGTEWDAILTAGITKNLSLMLKYADFERASPTMPASRTKTWIMLQYKL